MEIESQNRNRLTIKDAWPRLTGAALLLAGLGLLAAAALSPDPLRLNFSLDRQLAADAPGFPELNAFRSATRLESYHIRQGETPAFNLDIAVYPAAEPEQRRAIVYLPDASDNGKQRRHNDWDDAMRAAREHSPADALFISWWDNAQRLDFMTGRDAWTRQPAAAAFPDPAEQALWRQTAGPFAADDARLRQLARWLSMDAEQARADMAATLPAGRPVYILTCADDLARLREIEALSGKKLGLEARFFPQDADIHRQISQVKSWANAAGTGDYLLQSRPGQGVLAWRVADAETRRSLLVKLLPFTHSLAEPTPGLNLIYRSAGGGYLSIHQWERD